MEIHHVFLNREKELTGNHKTTVDEKGNGDVDQEVPEIEGISFVHFSHFAVESTKERGSKVRKRYRI